MVYKSEHQIDSIQRAGDVLIDNLKINMKKIFIHKIGIALLAMQFLISCEQSFDQPDIQNNPNAVTDVTVQTLLAGTMLGVSMLHEDTDVRIASMWAGELAGHTGCSAVSV